MEKNVRIRRLGRNEKTPYDLLLLADESIESINKYIFDCEIYVLELENKIVAEYALQQINDEEVEIKNIAVTNELQGQGIGKMLLKDAEDKARLRGFKSIAVGTGDVATKQLNLYQKCGFEIFGMKKKFFVENFPSPIYEDGKQLKDMIMLKKKLEKKEK